VKLAARTHRNSDSSLLEDKRRPKNAGTTTPNPASVYLAKQAHSTQATQRSALARVAAILLDRTADPETFAWHSITYGDVARLRGELVARFAPATVNRILAAVRGTLRETWAAGLLDQDARERLLYGLKNMRTGRLQAGRVLAGGEVAGLFQNCAQDLTPAGVRDAAIVGLMVGAGLRRGEVSALAVADVDLAGAAVRVLGKGDQERRVPLVAPVVAQLEAWLSERGRARGSLFAPVRRGKIRRGRLGVSALWRVVTRRAKAAGLERMSPHDCRRTAATTMLELGADLAIVQRILGHRNIATTTRYDRRGLEAERHAVGLLESAWPGAAK
jgi:integrase/recombinase XerD